MGFDSPVHWLIVVLVIALLFGGSRVGNLMGELGKGLKAFKSNLNEDADSGQDASKTDPSKTDPSNTGATSGTPETASARIGADASGPAAGESQGATKREPAPAGQEETAGHGERR